MINIPHELILTIPTWLALIYTFVGVVGVSFFIDFEPDTPITIKLLVILASVLFWPLLLIGVLIDR